jgi:hypothetical protein
VVPPFFFGYSPELFMKRTGSPAARRLSKKQRADVSFHPVEVAGVPPVLASSPSLTIPADLGFSTYERGQDHASTIAAETEKVEWESSNYNQADQSCQFVKISPFCL